MTTAGAHDPSLQSWLATALRVPADPAWRMTVDGYQPALEHDSETRLAIGNGLLGVRGSLEIPTPASRPRTFIAGLFDTVPGKTPHSALVPGPDWLRLNLTAGHTPVTLDSGTTLVHRRTLDFQRGVLLTEWRQCVPSGQTIHLRALRCVSLANRSLALQIIQITVDQPTRLTLEACLAAPEDGLHAVPVAADLLAWRTHHSRRYLAATMSATLTIGAQRYQPLVQRVDRQCWQWLAQPNQPAICIRYVALARGETLGAAQHTVRAARAAARRAGPVKLLAAHEQAWAARWQAADVVVQGDAIVQQGLRFALYHLISAANPDDPQVSIGARALTGDAYQGHVFWDTELFLLPVYTLIWPEAARALLGYRWRTLPAARDKARRAGNRGAWYAWESTDTGTEMTPTEVTAPNGQIVLIRNGTQELHISTDVAYAVWQYWQRTGDDPFLLAAGAEILLETARYWASRATREADGNYHIRQVIGPDEYHEGVDDNAYTNGMARWNIACALQVANLLSVRWPERWAELQTQLGLTPQELEAWKAVGAGLVTGFDPATGLFEQFTGYFRLQPIDLAVYAERTAPMDVILGREQTQRSQVIKQADVLMLLALLWEQFPEHVLAANIAYYEPRCGHGSSLSPPIHALLAARLGDGERALRYLHQTAALDLQDVMGNTALGVHIATLGGLWQAVVLGVAGLSFDDQTIRCDPHLPPTWQCLQFPVQWRDRRIRVMVEQPPALTVTLETGPELTVAVGDRCRTIQPGQTIRWRRRAGEERWQEVGDV